MKSLFLLQSAYFLPCSSFVSTAQLGQTCYIHFLLCSCQTSFRNTKQDREGWLLLNGLCMVNGHIRSLTLCLSGSLSRCWCWLLAAVINVSHKQTHTENTPTRLSVPLCFTNICTNTSRETGRQRASQCVIFMHTRKGMLVTANTHTEVLTHTWMEPGSILAVLSIRLGHSTALIPIGWLSHRPDKHTHTQSCFHHFRGHYTQFLKTDTHPKHNHHLP